MRLSIRLMVAMGMVVLLTVCINSIITYHNLVNTVVPVALDQMLTDVEKITTGLSSVIRKDRADLLAVRWSNSVNGLLRASEAGGIDPRGGGSYTAWRSRLESDLDIQLATHPEFLQFRLIGNENDGKEIVRVERTRLRGETRIVPENELQSKGHRDYFIEAAKLEENGIHISPIGLNREYNEIQKPYTPVLRLATPVHMRDGSLYGILVINIDIRNFFEQLRNENPAQQAYYLINSEGDYLLHPDTEKEFGFELGTPSRIQDDLPYVSDLIGVMQTDVRVWKNMDGDRYGLAFQPFRIQGGPWLAMIKQVSYQTIIAPVSPVLYSSLVSAVFSIVCAILLSGVVSKTLIRALSQIAKAVERFKTPGSIIDSPETGVEEINTLGNAFNKMSLDLSEKIVEKERVAEQFRRVVEFSPSGIIMVDKNGGIILANTRTLNLFGYERSELTGKNVEMLVPERFRRNHAGLRKGFLYDMEPRQMGEGRDLFALRKDGREFPVEIALTPIETDEGMMVLTTIIDITERKHSEDIIRASLTEKEVLLKEVYHRVKNNLEIISSLLSLQERRLPEGITREALRDSGTRVKSMALVHNMLYQSEKYTSIDIRNYLDRLIREFRSAHGKIAKRVDVISDVDCIELDIGTAIPLGLLVNELLSNCFRYAFPGARTGKVEVVLKYEHDSYILSVSDNGIGISDNFDITSSTSLGFTLVKALAGQLGGDLKIKSDKGTRVTVKFRKEEI